jgi:hypothetical protein
MFNQDVPNPFFTPADKPVAAKKPRRTLYAAIAILLALVLVVSAVLANQGGFVPQTSQTSQEPEEPEATPDYGSSMPLRLNYAVGEQMVYKTTNIVTNPSPSSEGTNTNSVNLTKTIRVIGETDDTYQVIEKIAISPDVLGNLPTVPVNISKVGYYNNYIPDVPSIFYNASANPTISAYLAQKSVNVDDVWTIPVNTGNSSYGMTGEVTLKFAGIEDVTVPAGTYKVMKIEITSTVLTLHSDGASALKLSDGKTLQLNGSTYLEQGTCRLIKTELTQSGPTDFGTSTIYTERILVEHTRP